jgi:hypothetical protein
LVLTEYQDAFPLCTAVTGQKSGCLLVLFAVKLSMAAQLGRIMTPAIARATDFRFRVRFIVVVALAGGPT